MIRFLRTGNLAPNSIQIGFVNSQQEVICDLIIQQQNHPKLPKTGYQIKELNPIPSMRKKGQANKLLTATIAYVESQLQADYLWIQVPKGSYSFFEALKFEAFSDEFEVADHGKVKEMYLAFYG